MRHRGFSLIELVVVLLIMTLSVALVAPLFTGGVTTELRSAARQLAAGLRAARNVAITRQLEATVVVDLEQRQFGVGGSPRKVRLPNPDDVDIRLYTAQSELIDEDSGNIRFFPDGSSTGGHIALSDRTVEYLVNVDWLTGRVVIQDRPVE